MKKIFYSIFAVAAISLVSCGAEEAKTEGDAKTADTTVVAIAGAYNVAEGATIVWKAKHNEDTSYVHVGTIPAAGNIVVENNAVIGGEFTFSIAGIDENGDTEWTKKLEDHFQDSTMFNAALFPSATFTITGTEAGKVMGDLTVLGVSQPVVIEGELTVTDVEVSFVGSAKVDMNGFAMPLLVASALAPEDQKGHAPDTMVIIEIDMKLAKAAI